MGQGKEMSLLERFIDDPCLALNADQDEIDEIIRALAIAQAAQEIVPDFIMLQVVARAIELAGEK